MLVWPTTGVTGNNSVQKISLLERPLQNSYRHCLCRERFFEHKLSLLLTSDGSITSFPRFFFSNLFVLAVASPHCFLSCCCLHLQIAINPLECTDTAARVICRVCMLGHPCVSISGAMHGSNSTPMSWGYTI